MVEHLEVGVQLKAKFAADGQLYTAEVLEISKSKKRTTTPVKVHYLGYGEEDDAWLPISDLRSRRFPREASAEKPAAPKTRQAKSKLTVSVLEKGMNLQVLADDGVWYAAKVLQLSPTKNTVKVNYLGYTATSNEWVGPERLRSKTLSTQGHVTDRNTKTQVAVKPQPALQLVPLLRRLQRHTKVGLERAIVESAANAESKTISYAELLANVQENCKVVASALVGRKEGMPKHVAYLINPSIAYVVTELSVWAAGACCVPLSVHSPSPELEYFVEDSEVPLLIADVDENVNKLKAVAEKLERTFATIAADKLKYTITVDGTLPDGEADLNTTMEANALILYTSGTTGKPKGVVHTFSSLFSQQDSLSKAWKWSQKDHTLHVLPLHHIHGVQNILNTAMLNGSGVEFTPFDAGFCLKRLCSGDITCFHAVPTIYTKFTQYFEKIDSQAKAEICKGLRNESMRYMVSGSAALPVPTMQAWAEISGHVLLERYGMTEIGMGLSNRITGTRYPGCVGWVLPKVQVKADENGSILIRGPLIFKEYYRREEATKAEFTEDGWFKTGDNCQVGGTPEELRATMVAARAVEAATGRAPATAPAAEKKKGEKEKEKKKEGKKEWKKKEEEKKEEEEGEEIPKDLKKIYRIMGRSSVDIIKSGGYKISALEIESVLLQHEKIKECAVIGKPDKTWGEKVTAVCILDGDLTLKDLRDWGKERMATYKVPQELDVVTELPRNQMGKLEKKKLIDKYKQTADAARGAAA